MILLEQVEDVAIIKLNRNITNAIGPDLVEALMTTLQSVENDPEINGLVLTSANTKFFSIGFNIPELYDAEKEVFARFFQSYVRLLRYLFTFPKPIVAAVTGHATAGGCFLALCCDYRYIAEGKKMMGINEIKLGVPAPYVGDCILRALVGFRNARDVLDSGDLYQPEALIHRGLVDKVLPLEQVLPAAVEKAALIGSMPPRAYAVIKRDRVEPVEEEIMGRLAQKDKMFVECWYSEAARLKLKEAMQKF